MPYIGQAGQRPYQDGARIAADPAYGDIVCHCERVTRGEISDALASPLPPADLDGLRRRTRATNGRCQGFFCAARVASLMARSVPQPTPTRRSRLARPRVRLTATAIRRERRRAHRRRRACGPCGSHRAAQARRRRGASGRPRAGGWRYPAALAHTGYGIRDLHRLMTGPAYARHYRRSASSAGVMVRTGTTLVGWPTAAGSTGQPPGRRSSPRGTPSGRKAPSATSQAGIEDVNAGAVLLATGCRERPRPARLVPGSRPAGVLTTGELQQRVFLHGQRLTGRAVVVGAEHVSFSAMLTLQHAGARVTALVTEQPRHQSFAAFQLAASLRWRVPVWTRTTVSGIAGRDEVSVVIAAGRARRLGSRRAVRARRVQR